MRVTQDGLGLLGDKGFRSARLNVPVREGKWYVEVTIEHGGGARSLEGPGSYSSREGAHVRLGFGRREAPLNGPCGLDGYSYGIRDKTGEKVTLSRTRPYGRAFGVGDTIGMYISLPPLRTPLKNDPHDPAHLKRERIAIDYKGQEYWESLEYAQSKEMIALMDTSRSNRPTETTSLPSSTKKSATVKNVPERGRGGKDAPPEPAPLRPLPTLPNSQIAFFVNGESQGTAFRDLYDFLPLRAPADKRKRDRGKRLREGAKEHTLNPFDDGSLGYYPLISLFNGARVRINPGPDFAFPPPPDIDATLNATQPSSSDPSPSNHSTTTSTERTWRPLNERYSEYMDEQWAMDKHEDEAARTEATARAVTESAEVKKAAQREKRKAQADAKKQKTKLEVDMERARERARSEVSREQSQIQSREASVAASGSGIPAVGLGMGVTMLRKEEEREGSTPPPIATSHPAIPVSIPTISLPTESTPPPPLPPPKSEPSASVNSTGPPQYGSQYSAQAQSQSQPHPDPRPQYDDLDEVHFPHSVEIIMRDISHSHSHPQTSPYPDPPPAPHTMSVGMSMSMSMNQSTPNPSLNHNPGAGVGSAYDPRLGRVAASDGPGPSVSIGHSQGYGQGIIMDSAYSPAPTPNTPGSGFQSGYNSEYADEPELEHEGEAQGHIRGEVEEDAEIGHGLGHSREVKEEEEEEEEENDEKMNRGGVNGVGGVTGGGGDGMQYHDQRMEVEEEEGS